MSSVIPAVNNYLVNNIVIFDIAYVVCYMYVLYIFLSTFYGEWSYCCDSGPMWDPVAVVFVGLDPIVSWSDVATK